MRLFIKLAVFGLVAPSLWGCNQAIDKAALGYLKAHLKNTCGDEDAACVAAVDEQFDSCHDEYQEAWDNYMSSSISEEGELLEIYSKGLYGCIVDKDGDPYFLYDPD